MRTDSSDYILRFMSECYSANGLEQLLKIAHKYFENPCALLDVSYKTLGYIGDDSFDDPLWNEIVHDGILSEEVLSIFIEDGYMSRQFKLLYPIFIPKIFQQGPTGSVRRLGVAIPANNDAHSGWLVVFEHNRPFIDMDLEIMSWFSKILSPQINELTANKIYPLGRIENLMLDILNDSVTDISITEKHLQILGWSFFQFNRILIIRSEDNDIPKALQESIVLTLKEHIDSITAFLYNGYFTLVLRSQKDIFAEIANDELEDFLKKFGMWSGFSAPFNTIADFKHHYDQAINCLSVSQIKGHAKRVAFFEDYAIDIMILMASNRFDVSEFCHPFLFKLQKYDQQQNTDYLDTLRQFVFHTGNLKAAAHEIGIHRNTLSYRIEKIQEILAVENFSQKLLSDLYMSFTIYDIIKLEKKVPL